MTGRLLFLQRSSFEAYLEAKVILNVPDVNPWYK